MKWGKLVRRERQGESAEESGVKKGNTQSDDEVGKSGEKEEEGQTEGEIPEQEKDNSDDEKAEDGQESDDRNEEKEQK